jgi:4-hydroxy-3-polyprenylbenzoate decarboxylase
MKRPICVGITGASGAVYAVRLLEVLRATDHDVELSISPSGADVIRQELNRTIDLEKFRVEQLLIDDSTSPSKSLAANSAHAGLISYHHWQNFMAPMASGSHLTAGMVICPCSGTTLSAVAAGAAMNLIQRAAEVHLKERRPLVLVPRETPLSQAHIENMRRATDAGAIVLPASPGWYHGPRQIADLVDFVVARICDQLSVEHSLMKRWGTD